MAIKCGSNDRCVIGLQAYVIALCPSCVCVPVNLSVGVLPFILNIFFSEASQVSEENLRNIFFFCDLQMLTNWTKLKFCHLVKGWNGYREIIELKVPNAAN